MGNLDDFAESGDEYSFTRRPMLKKRRQQALSPNFNTNNEGFFGVSEFGRLGGSDSLNTDTVSSRYYHRNRTSTKEHAFANCKTNDTGILRSKELTNSQHLHHGIVLELNNISVYHFPSFVLYYTYFLHKQYVHK